MNAAESALQFKALEEQAARLMEVFARAGYEHVAPAIIQPASLFLDRIGEAIRARTYVFADPNGEELCLRPDLTAPVCRLYLERLAKGQARPGGAAKFCYNGPAFRMQEGRPDPLRPREFRQAGIEYFSGACPREADFEAISLTIGALRAAGLRRFHVRLGHLGLFCALLNSLSMPERWQRRLRRAFRRPKAFARELKALASGGRGSDGGGKVLEEVGAPGHGAGVTEADVLARLDKRGLAMMGLRRPAEIAQILSERAADARERPLDGDIAARIEAYLDIGGSVPASLRALREIVQPLPPALAGLIGDLEILHGRLIASGLDPGSISFAADFGRQIEYYTGMVFEIEAEGADGPVQIAGGGRYDGLLRAIAGEAREDGDAPAVGAAIHTERLLAAAAGAQRS